MTGLLGFLMAGPERFELPTFWFVARHSIQLSYGPAVPLKRAHSTESQSQWHANLAEREGFEPSMRL